MAAKLKSITRLIHWFLLARTLIFVLAWLYLPFWLFVLLALYCYFIRIFRAGRWFMPFLTLLILCAAEPPGILMALIFGAIFYYLLLIKDLLLIDRTSAHELLVIILSFFLFREFFAKFDQGPTNAAIAWALLTALLFAILLGQLMPRKYEAALRGERELPLLDEIKHDHLRRASRWLAFVVTAELLVAILFLPVNFIYQSVLAFLLAVLFIELLPEHAAGVLTTAKIRLTGTVVGVLLIVVLTAAKWGM